MLRISSFIFINKHLESSIKYFKVLEYSSSFLTLNLVSSVFSFNSFILFIIKSILFASSKPEIFSFPDSTSFALS